MFLLFSYSCHNSISVLKQNLNLEKRLTRNSARSLGVSVKTGEQNCVPSVPLTSLSAGFSVLLKLLDSENEMIVGNAAFCLGQCLGVPGAAASLLNSNVVMILLKHAGGDATRTSVQQNAAIALGKLCVAEPRYCKSIVLHRRAVIRR